MIRLAELQTSFTIIDDVLRITNRRVNAMDCVLIPRYKANIAFVDFNLDENEREEFFRLKKVQERRKVVQAKQEEERLARYKKVDNPVVETNNILEDTTEDSDLLF